MARILITGANGHLGRRLINALPAEHEVEALVRSQHARRILQSHTAERPQLNVTIADPSNAADVAGVASRCDRAVHLIGMIRGTPDNRYVDSHQRPAQALAQALGDTNIEQVIYVSILGADSNSISSCLRARADVEGIFQSTTKGATIIRVPMVLGERDRASFALKKRARAKRVTLIRADSLEQPIYAGDVVAAMVKALAFGGSKNELFDLAGPVSLPRRELVTRAAALLNNRPSIISLPLSIGMAGVGLLEWLSPKPRITREMLRVLDHDDAIDPTPACAALGLKLTPLDEMLRRCVLSPSA